jgi:hypothetical protein
LNDKNSYVLINKQELVFDKFHIIVIHLNNVHYENISVLNKRSLHYNVEYHQDLLYDEFHLMMRTKDEDHEYKNHLQR